MLSVWTFSTAIIFIHIVRCSCHTGNKYGTRVLVMLCAGLYSHSLGVSPSSCQLLTPSLHEHR